MQHTASHQAPDTLATYADEDEIDLRLLLARIWKSRKLILTGTLIIVATAIMVSEFFAKYQSEGYLKINNLTPATYRIYQPTLLNIDRFRAYTAEIGLKDSQSVDFIEELLSLSPEKLDKFASLTRSVTVKDAKENIIGKEKDKELNTVYLGIDLKIPGSTPEMAQVRSKIFAEYYVDSIIYADLSTWVDHVIMTREIDAYSNKLDTIRVKRGIDEAEKKLDALRALVKRYPDASRMEVRQVLSIENGGERFLSPVAQIVAAESANVDARIELLTLLRKQKQIDLTHAFYKQAAQARSTTNSGREFLKKLLALKDGVAKNILAADEDGMEVVNEISRELEKHNVSYTTDFKFLLGPTLPEKKTKISPLLITLGAGAGGMFLMVILALLMSWWQQNDKFIAQQDSAAANAA